MALVRVYCGLVSAYPPRQLAVGSSSLYVTIVDDAGRVLDVCEIGDDSYGYAYLSALLAERATGPYSVAIATNSDQRLVPMLLAAAGWALAVVDDESTDDFADRFADEFHDEVASAPTQRRALGLARALQGGALSAALLPAPAELADLKPVLSALGALATGRHATAMALREVLRELYPAALRAYPDPADPVALAVMDAFPEPGTLGSSAAGRSRDAAAAADAVAARLAAAGLADQAAVTEAITALRVAIAETPRRSGISRSLTATVAEAVRQAVSAVRSYDAASTAVVTALADRVTPPATAKHAAVSPASPGQTSAGHARSEYTSPSHASASQAHASASQAHASPATAPPAPAPAAAPPRSRTAIPRAARTPVVASGSPVPPAAPATDRHHLPATPPPPAGPPAASVPPRPAAAPPPPSRPMSPPQPAAPPSRPMSPSPLSSPPMSSSPPAMPSALPPPRQMSSPPLPPPRPMPSPPPPSRQLSPPPPPQPVAPPPVAPPPVTPPPQAAPRAPASAAPYNRPVSPPPPPPPGITPITEPRAPLPTRARGQTNDQVRVPVPRPTLEGPPPGSRADWPTSPPANDWASPPLPTRGSRESGTNGSAPTPVTPPWRADDLKPPEAPMLRLVEPTLPEELRDDLGYLSRSEPRPLRLVEPSRNGIPRSAPPVSADNDGTLLIFEQTRSAWFSEDDEASWGSAMDLGWQAAEQAARPTVGDRTDAGLPRRVPHANLVPGAPPRRDDRPLRVVRNAASIAEHTSGYFSGWRRGQEVGGYPLGGRQRRPSGGAWEFHRDDDRLSS